MKPNVKCNNSFVFPDNNTKILSQYLAPATHYIIFYTMNSKGEVNFYYKENRNVIS